MKKFHKHNIELLKYLTKEEGVVAVEFGMISVLFLTMSFGVAESGRVLWAKNSLQNTLEKTSRYVLVNSNLTDEEILAYAKARMGEMYSDSDGLTLNVNRTTLDGVDVIEIDGAYDYESIIPFMPDSWQNLNLDAQASIPVPELTPTPTPAPTQAPEPEATPEPTSGDETDDDGGDHDGDGDHDEEDHEDDGHGQDDHDDNGSTPEPTPAPTETPEPTPEPTETPEPTPEPTPTPTSTPAPTEPPEQTVCNNGGNNCHPVCPIGHSWNNRTNSCR